MFSNKPNLYFSFNNNHNLDKLHENKIEKERKIRFISLKRKTAQIHICKVCDSLKKKGISTPLFNRKTKKKVSTSMCINRECGHCDIYL